MYRLYLFIFTLLCCPALAQDNFNDTAWWERLVHEKKPAINDFSLIDTCIVVVSNRMVTDNGLRFMSETRGNGSLQYFFVYAYKDRWHVLKASNLQKAISYMPKQNNDWVVYTEGMGKIFTSELNRGMQMNAQYDVNVIMLDYPSITTTKRQLGNYLFSIKNARASYKDHAPVLQNIKKLYTGGKMGKGNMTLFFHSMGNYLLRQTVRKKQLFMLNDKRWVDNIILNAPCVPQHAHAKWVNQINFSERIYVHYNPEDNTLYWPELFNKKKQLGRRLRGPLSAKVNYINFHSLVGDNHSYFLSLQGREPVLPISWQHYNKVLHGDSVVLEAKPYKPSIYKNRGVDILPD